MSATSRLLIRLARWTAGRERREWTDAMAAEAASTGHSVTWAIGCLWASLQDRLRRDWWFLIAVLLLPIGALVWKAVVFFSTSSLLVSGRISATVAVAFWILSPFPIVFLFTRWRQGLSAYLAVAISFAVVEFAPIAFMWIDFGLSPWAWFGPNSHWYKADPNIVIGTTTGLTLDLLAWLTGAWLGSHSRFLRASG